MTDEDGGVEDLVQGWRVVEGVSEVVHVVEVVAEVDSVSALLGI